MVSPPSGVTIKTRLGPSPAQEQALREVGALLGALYRCDLVTRLSQGRLDTEGQAESRRVGKKDLTAGSSWRWAGSITRATQDQYDLGIRALTAERDMLVGASATLSEPIAAPVGGAYRTGNGGWPLTPSTTQHSVFQFPTFCRAHELAHELMLVTVSVPFLPVGEPSEALDLFLQLDHLELAPDGQSLEPLKGLQPV